MNNIRAFIAISLIINYAQAYNRAIVNLNSGSITGSIIFTETDDGVSVEGRIIGMEPGLYGLHIHKLGDTSDCLKTLAHFNPDETTHGKLFKVINRVSS